MSRAWGDEDRPMGPPVGLEDLREHMRSGFKEPANWLLGLELEKLGTHSDGRALSFYGPGGVEEVLASLERESGLSARREEDHIVGLEGDEGAGVTLEPGGQMEFTSAPRSTLTALERDICIYLERVDAASGPDRHWLGLGLQPLSPLASMRWISRERYRIMRTHLGARGDLAHRMMTQTAGVQVNLDFKDEADAAAKMRTAMGVTSIVTAAFANSPIDSGRPNGWASYRTHIWTRTDPERCGILRQAVEGEGMGPQEWLEYALDVPLMFLVREGRYLAVEDRTFRRFLEKGYEDFHPVLSDWEVHLTTIFPEVRFKTYMEVRGMDAVPRDLALAGVALWKGLLYSASACDKAWRLVAGLSWEERQQLHEEAARRGTEGHLRGRRLGDWAADLVRIAHEGLTDLRRGAPEAGEERFLEPLKRQLTEGKGSPAFELLRLWEEELGGDFHRLVEHTAHGLCTDCPFRREGETVKEPLLNL